jgi:hypothetical protein
MTCLTDLVFYVYVVNTRGGRHSDTDGTVTYKNSDASSSHKRLPDDNVAREEIILANSAKVIVPLYATVESENCKQVNAATTVLHDTVLKGGLYYCVFEALYFDCCSKISKMFQVDISITIDSLRLLSAKLVSQQYRSP